MGTRGLWGFRKDGKDKLTYNHFDSYPDCLGHTIIEFLKKHTKKELEDIAKRIVLVDEDKLATAEAMVLCKKYCDTGVSTQQITDWYCLLRGAQGCPEAYADGLRFMIDDAEFIKNSLFCEYAYIINLDDNVLEYWVGFQKKPDKNNRYGIKGYDKYYPCKLMKKFSLYEIKTKDIYEILTEMNFLDRRYDCD